MKRSTRFALSLLFLLYNQVNQTKFREIYNLETSINESVLSDELFMRKLKSNGFSDRMIANLRQILKEH
jgi:hypothetical protein